MLVFQVVALYILKTMFYRMKKSAKNFKKALYRNSSKGNEQSALLRTSFSRAINA